MDIDRGDIDPRLREPPQTVAQPYSILPPPSPYPLNPIRLPPPQQQQHHNALPPPWQQEGSLPYYNIRESQQHNLPPPDIHPHHDNTFPQSQPSEGTPNSESKRPRACEACRGLKVKCDPDPVKKTCRRCAKAGRTCVVTAPSRKRQKKTDSRVAELEKKINALEASLHATKGDGSSGSEDEGSYDDDDPLHVDMNRSKIRPERMQDMLDHGVEIAGRYSARRQYQSNSLERNRREPENSPQASHSLKRRMSEYHEDESTITKSESRRNSRNDSISKRPTKKPSDANIHPFLVNEASKSGASSSILADSTAPCHEYADVVDRKILDAATAAKIFYYYTTKMASHMPIVVFPADVAAGTIRKTKPTLFLAILSIASAQDYPHLQSILTREIMRAYADQLICKREKSLELIQALQVSTTWYSTGANCYQLIHMAAVMGIELGISTRPKGNRDRFLELWKDDSHMKSELEAKDTIDSKRAWLGCYFLCANAAMGSRRINLTRWTPYMDECLHDLETSKDSLPSDKTFCQWVRVQRRADDLGTQISTDDVSHTSMSDPKIQYALKAFERQMKDWENQKPAQVTSRTLAFGFHVINLYMHDFAMPLDYGLENARTVNQKGHHKNNNTRPEVLTTPHVGGLTTCLISIHGIFDTFLEFNKEDIRTLPIFHFARLARASIVLIRMHFAATAQDSELGKVMPSDHMKVEHYLSGLIDLLQAAALDEKCHPAHRAYMILKIMKLQFERCKEGKTGLVDKITIGSKVEAQPVDTENFGLKQDYRKMQLDGDEFPLRSPPSKDPTPQQTSSRPLMGDRALHMLSDVAMTATTTNNNPPNNPHHVPPSTDGWYGYPPSGIHSTAPVYGSSSDFYHPASMAGVESAAYAGLHPGFEQAIGMTLGEGDLNIMDDDGFYHIMQAAPGLFGQI